MRDKVDTRDLRLAELAACQHGVVSSRQLTAIGLDRSAVRRRCRSGRLHRVHRGVYAVGYLGLSPERLWMAAILACGHGGFGSSGTTARDWTVATALDDAYASTTILDRWGAAISHRSAAALWDLLPRQEGPAHVSVPSAAGKAKRLGVVLHRTLTLEPRAVTLRKGIPVTTPTRTIADLRRATGRRGGEVSQWELRRAMREADVLGLRIESLAHRDRTRSDLERDFLALCRRHRLPEPEVNVRVGPYLADFLWREQRLVVETDGYIYHRGRTAFEDDHVRGLRLRALGYEVLRIADTQIDEAPAEVAAVIRAVLEEPPPHL
jgi:very-short-patch-repair endonuclease